MEEKHGFKRLDAVVSGLILAGFIGLIVMFG